MARVLIVGCGCRGRELAAVLTERGHVVRGTSRDPRALAHIAAAGAEPALADPDRIGTLMEALTGVTVVCWLAGTAHGEAEQVAALHGDRLRMLFERLVDTPVRGLVYEAAGSLAPEHYARGRRIAQDAQATWRLPVAAVAVEPAAHAQWLAAMAGAVDELLTPGGDRR